MKFDSLIPTPHIAHWAGLTAAFEKVRSSWTELDEAEALFGTAKSGLCEDADFLNGPTKPPSRPFSGPRMPPSERDQQRVMKEKMAIRDARRIEYFGCKLRVVHFKTELQSAVDELKRQITATRTVLDASRPTQSEFFAHECAMFNLVCADALVVKAAKRLRDLSKNHALWYGVTDNPGKRARWPETEVLAPGVEVNVRKLLEEEYVRSAREWVVMSSGHGSNFRFSGTDGTQVPPGPYMTRAEAVDDCAYWESYADTIGGAAQLYNVRTGKTESWTD
jgi:hypothetical protein